MKAKKLISWKVLDRYKTSRGIAAFLRKNKVVGEPGKFDGCPLAIATGYVVSHRKRWKPEVWEFSTGTRLTRAQKDFVHQFDIGKYPDLEFKEK